MIDLETGNSRFGEVLEAVLRQKRMTQSQLAKKANISQSTVSKLISGKRLLTVAFAERICPALGGTPESWLQAQTEIVAGSQKSVSQYVAAITGIRAVNGVLDDRIGTRVTQLWKADILKVFDPQNDGRMTLGKNSEPCQIDPFDPSRVKLTSYDTRAGQIGTPPDEQGWWTGEEAQNAIEIPPHGVVHVGTAEHITFPSWLQASLNPASNITRKALIVGHGPIVDPLFDSHLYVTVYNPTDQPKHIDLDEPFLTLQFWLAED
jgi:addiction module HigA family antidote